MMIPQGYNQQNQESRQMISKPQQINYKKKKRGRGT